MLTSFMQFMEMQISNPDVYLTVMFQGYDTAVYIEKNIYIFLC